MKAILLKLYNFIQREFVADSRQYFEQRFYSAFDLISFNNNQVVHWDNKKEFEFFSIQKQYSFIDDLIFYRKKINTLEEYCDISYDIIIDYLHVLKKDNTLYTNDFFESKQEVIANNIVKDKRRDFFRDLKSIFSMIEEKHSIDLEKNNKEEIKKKVKSEYNLVALKYMILNEFKKVPFEYHTYEERNKKIVQKESNFYKEVINSGSVKSGFKNVGDFEIFLNKDKNSDYIDVLKQDTDIANEKDIILFLDKLKKN